MNVRQMLTLVAWMAAVTVAVVLVWYGEEYNQNLHLRLATGPEYGAYRSIGEGIAAVVTDPNIEIEALVSDGSVENMMLLAEGEVELAIVQNDTQPTGNICTLIPLHRGVCHFLVPQDSDIQKIQNLRGRRVAVGSRQSGNWHVVRHLLDHFGVTEDRFDVRYLGIAACEKAFDNDEIDAALIITAITSQSLKDLVETGKLRYVALGTHAPANEVDGFSVTYPYVERFTIPRYVYPIDNGEGIPRVATESFALRSTLVCREDLPDSVARRIVSDVVTNRAKIMRDHYEAHDISEFFTPSEVQYPLHHGATAYYQRQRPGFLERYSEPMAFGLSLILALCGMVAGFNQWLTLKKKNRIDRYYVRLDALLDELNEHNANSKRLDAIEQELISMRHDALRELVNERLLADDSFQIFQSLLTDCHQQLTLLRASPAKPE